MRIAFLISSQVILMLLVWGPDSGNSREEQYVWVIVKNRNWYILEGKKEVGRVRLEQRVTLEIWDGFQL